ncbi:WxL domain-containing protein [Lactiplantibacillus mudanjiangensis]|uniref:Extracellular protein [Lactobacillus plantarum JDM1] n=1 Tax=Lactiplantibacillus mudanjiangensis TaxID=1296538 RepID=A0A660E8G6_9LACO|nr:WxL domain-containing protein [Lactiplantibacillus mudanjiangensis]VDG25882.1 extracellular protein [Lactobacillus plantarum JDM1] [Lactiplantibacillus mudanjiangensis]VDG28686.1 extracellular protein [Lactobacillus plantarum JDM1] [Lactiplantibacillus mudanjiangensis]VDG33715.1 extracellular protein [Lactobacillus plantarum JDM1] [Lactiplantibacillus mudanjiangensis]
MKKTLLGLLFSAALIATSGLAANADDAKPQTSNGTVGFEGGSITIDNGDTDLSGASLDFGTNKIQAANTDDNYDNTNKSAAVSVVDLRGTAAGWDLRVKQNDVFKNDKAAANKELTGAVLTLNGVLDQNASTTGADATVNTGVALDTINSDKSLMAATTGKGNGKNVADIKASQLMVPKTTARAEGSYSTTLTWSLNATPANS